MSRKTVQHERRRQILDALHQCLLVKPFDKTSIKDIAARAGLNHGMLHYYFKSKDDILVHYIEYVIETYRTTFQDWLETRKDLSSSPREFLASCFDFMYERITLNTDISRIFVEIQEISLYNGMVREKLKMAYGNWIDTVTDLISLNCDDAETARAISAALVAFLEGLSMMSVTFESSEFPLEAVLEKSKRLFVDTLVAGES